MMTPSFIVFPLLLLNTPAWSGEISGSVRVKEFDAKTGAFKDANNHENVVVYINGLVEKRKDHRQVSLNQFNQEFSARVLPITEGEEVLFKNEDKIYHNIWSLSKAKQFDLGTFKAPESKKVTFDQAGIVKVFCNIHPQMISTIIVLKNTKYAITGPNGEFSIKDIPEGRFELRAWAEGTELFSKQVTVKKNSAERVSVTVQRKLTTAEDHLNKLGEKYKKAPSY